MHPIEKLCTVLTVTFLQRVCRNDWLPKSSYNLAELKKIKEYLNKTLIFFLTGL